MGSEEAGREYSGLLYIWRIDYDACVTGGHVAVVGSPDGGAALGGVVRGERRTADRRVCHSLVFPVQVLRVRE